ncbi:MAG: stage III sporulation protein AE [Christensenellales bacterium]
MLAPSSVYAQDLIEEALVRQIEDDITDNIDRALSSADLNEIESYFEMYAKELEPLTGGDDFQSFIQMLATGGGGFDIAGVFSLLLNFLFAGIKQSLPVIIQIIVVALMFSVITHFAPSFGGTGVSKAALTAQYVIVGTMTIGVLASAFSIGTDAISGMTQFTADFFPLLIALLTALGGITASAILSPATVLLTTGISLFYKSFVLPVVIVLTVLTVISHFSATVKLTGFCTLLKSVVKWAIGVSSTVFIGIIMIQGLLGSTIDGLTIKTAKYTVDKFVPIVGGMISDSADVLVSCTLLVKNAVGVCGVIIIIGIVISPLFALLAHYFVFKLAGAVLEPISGQSMSKFAQDAAGVLLLLFAALAAAAVMFFVTTAVIIGAGGQNVMLR